MRVVGTAFVVSAIAVSCIFVTSVTTEAQSLADVAQREADRRGAVRSSGKVYTNGSLVEDFTKPAPPTPSVTPPKAEPASAANSEKPSDESVEVPVAEKGRELAPQPPSDKGEDYWRRKATTLRTAIAAQKAQIVSLEARVGSFAEAKTGTDLRERDLSTAALQKAKADLVFLEEDKTRFEAIAKSKNVPPAWLQ